MKTQFNSLKFCATLKVWRKMHGMSVTDMMDLTGIARSTYGFIESADRAPTLAEFSHLCQLMDFDAGDFFEEKTK
jgi:transcriptional regulator with XRE-family HTH domain